jgi:hypothetical protein
MGRIPPAYNRNDWPLELGRLVALAERFASEGQMNLNKLVEAAVYKSAALAGVLVRRSQPRPATIILAGPLRRQLGRENMCWHEPGAIRHCGLLVATPWLLPCLQCLSRLQWLPRCSTILGGARC